MQRVVDMCFLLLHKFILFSIDIVTSALNYKLR